MIISLYFLFFWLITCEKVLEDRRFKIVNENAIPEQEVNENKCECNCENKIYRECNHRSVFTEEEIEIAKNYIQHKFLNEAKYKPLLPKCSKMYVRKDWKCMSEEERIHFINIWRKLVSNGDIEELAQIHELWWPSTYKTQEFAMFHRKMGLELEKKMRKISPDIYLPYWSAATDFAHPQMSIIFDYFGTAGNYSNGFCLTDGPCFTNYPIAKRRCTKRQRREDGTIPAWAGPELDTLWLQHSGNNWTTFTNIGTALNFLVHFGIGGYYGDNIIPFSALDPTFYLYHVYIVECIALKLQLSHKDNLTPELYNNGVKIDQDSGKVVAANIETDKLVYWRNTSVLQVFQMGFGENCFIPDIIVLAINNIVNNKRTVKPSAIDRLPKSIQKKYFPKFYSGQYTEFDHLFEDVGECNRKCKPIPMFEIFNETQNGRQLLNRFKYDQGLDSTSLLDQSIYIDLVNALNNNNYCSPYIP